jgi:hypothetical protein
MAMTAAESMDGSSSLSHVILHSAL